MASLLSINSISKSFGSNTILHDLSFTVEHGEIFGLLGPNGAGKTTTLRIILDLLRPDSGEVQVLGGALDERKKDRIGYMPEERGLYSNLRLADCLIYFATLKSLSTRDASLRAERALKQFGLWEDRKKQIGQLSRGMAQKAQIIAATLHDPELLIIDEPFANLDPLNAQLIQELLRGMRARGQSIILSSHQMHLVESLCDRILLMDQGRALIYGSLRDVKYRFAQNQVRLTGDGDFSDLPGVTRFERNGRTWRLTLSEQMASSDLLRCIANRSDLRIERFEIALPSLDEIFVQVVAGRAVDG